MVGLSDDIGDIDERLEVLTNVKWTCEEFPCALTRDIVELCDREADLLNRGRSVESMVNLRRRLTSLFRQFVDTPEFNPEADRFLKVPGVRLMNTRARVIWFFRKVGASGRRAGAWASKLVKTPLL